MDAQIESGQKLKRNQLLKAQDSGNNDPSVLPVAPERRIYSAVALQFANPYRINPTFRW
jgi:hypothetical protein